MSASSSGACALYGALALVYVGLAADFYITYKLSGDVNVLRSLVISDAGDLARGGKAVTSKATTGDAYSPKEPKGAEISRERRSTHRHGRYEAAAAIRARGASNNFGGGGGSGGGSDNDQNVPSVEFFPQPQQASGGAHDGKGYVWLTSYSRIPVSGAPLVTEGSGASPRDDSGSCVFRGT
ncbi:hypothetical protein V5799_008950 [Amblyomma americanum]|uniref:Uncharacterized protein n=1 Tax=Amblyomma americanum TaxID=6943 RepID=A0AAQ4FBL5_AMBAM